MKKYITLILGCLLMAACKQEVLEPGQMIQGRFALDEGIGLTDEFLHFDKGHLSIYWATTPYPFAEGKIWCCQNVDVFYLNNSSGYSITDGWLNSSRFTGPIELKDGKLSIGDRIYYALELFEDEPYSSVTVINRIICPYVERNISIPYTIVHPLPSGSLQCSTETDWITDLAVQNGEITAHLSATSSNRDGAISVSYPYVDPIIITVEQRPFTFIRLEEETRTVDYTAQNVVLPYTIDNPVSGSSLTAVSSASWINNIRVSENQISFNVAENNAGSSRSATITLRYEGASDVVFTVTQQWSAPVITLTPSSQTLDYTGGTFSFDYTITNPREGMTVTAVSQAIWITDVTVSGTTVSYKVAENNSGQARTGTIKLTYGTSNLATASFTVTQTYEAPRIELTPTSNEVDYTGGTFSFDYSIVNPREGAAVTISTIPSWISDVNISGSTVAYKVAENNSGGKRTGAIKLTYSGLVTTSFNVTQTYAAPTIVLTTNTIELDYTGGTFSLNYDITNPRAGVSVEVSSQVEWITVVGVLGETVNCKVAANAGYRLRSGKINLKYGNYTSASFSVTQDGYPLPEGAVDLGLSVLWASCNLGASSPKEYGDYYAWGETSPYYSSQNPLTWKSGKSSGYAWSSYSLCNGSFTTLTKYNNSSSYGTVDNMTTFKDYNYADDAARTELGYNWRIPTRSEFQELYNNCTSELTTFYGQYGCKFISKKSGYTDKWIFLSAAGVCFDTTIGHSAGSYGYYWSSSRSSYGPPYGSSLRFSSSGVDVNYRSNERCYGLSVRPVCDL